VSTAVALDPDKRAHLIKLLGMLGSNFAGERENAGKMADELVRAAGTTWREILTPKEGSAPAAPTVPQGPRTWVHFIEDVIEKHYGALRSGAKYNELEFLTDMLARGLAPSPKQEKWLRDIGVRCGVPLWDGATAP
jgi:hypothetical protein